MEPIVKALIVLALLSSSVAFADDVTSTTSSVTTTTGDTTNRNAKPQTQSTVTHSTTTTTTVHSGDSDIVSATYKQFAKSSALIGTTLTVSCDNGIVTLDGSVTAQSQADEAVRVAKSIEGVKDVRSTITVTSNPNIKPPIKTPNY